MPSSDCVFCKIVAGEIPCRKIFENESLIAFDDITPMAPVHFLVVSKEHIATLDDAEPRHTELLGRMLATLARLAREKGVATEGYRQVINCGKAAGQVVPHLHMHALGGRPMRLMG
ncbi:MAG: histidine triad nucleotide-binding protein [Deltaproteobacteria bacterium]|nr:histidine triad nucleotide-binding protein [Deltaproteobacteria bacterium]